MGAAGRRWLMAQPGGLTLGFALHLMITFLATAKNPHNLSLLSHIESRLGTDWADVALQHCRIH